MPATDLVLLPRGSVDDPPAVDRVHTDRADLRMGGIEPPGAGGHRELPDRAGPFVAGSPRICVLQRRLVDLLPLASGLLLPGVPTWVRSALSLRERGRGPAEDRRARPR